MSAQAEPIRKAGATRHPRRADQNMRQQRVVKKQVEVATLFPGSFLEPRAVAPSSNVTPGTPHQYLQVCGKHGSVQHGAKFIAFHFLRGS